MKKIINILPAGSWAESGAADQFIADYEGRHRRRIVLTLESEERVLLDLKQARLLAHGDGLVLDDDRIIKVVALPEPLMAVTAHTPLHLLQLAWHLGNRHLPAMIEEHRILVRQDPVIADMIAGLGGHIHPHEAPFSPESGAYAGRGEHSHSHSHSHEDHSSH